MLTDKTVPFFFFPFFRFQLLDIYFNKYWNGFPNSRIISRFLDVIAV